MNTTPNSVVTDTSANSTKLMSLLALASGAVAIPQTGQADIIYHDMNANPTVVGFAGTDVFQFTLPGAAQVGFIRQETIDSTPYIPGTATFRTVFVGALVGTNGFVRGNPNLAAPLPAAATWSQGGVATFYNIAVGAANNYGRNPLNGFDRQYLAWGFRDTTQGNALRYGWVEISLSINNVTFPAGGSGPNVTIWGYAYDTTGAKPTMGAVPEPASGTLLALGAMALGARGLRKWREKRQAAAQN